MSSGRSSGCPASRLNTLLGAARPYKAATVDELRTRAVRLAAAEPATIAP
ncbi:hypothetical protein ACFCWG_27265 [Streptomyces sp. NPDC056390]